MELVSVVGELVSPEAELPSMVDVTDVVWVLGLPDFETKNIAKIPTISNISTPQIIIFFFETIFIY
jgi:hypothetical protein